MIWRVVYCCLVMAVAHLASFQTVSAQQVDLIQQLETYAEKAVAVFRQYVNEPDPTNEALYETIIHHYTQRVSDLYDSAQRLRHISLAFATERITAMALYMRALILNDPGEVRQLLLRSKELWPNVEETTITMGGQVFKMKQLLEERFEDIDTYAEIQFTVRFDPQWPYVPTRIPVEIELLPGSDKAANLKLKKHLNRQALAVATSMEKGLASQKSPFVIKAYLPPEQPMVIRLADMVFQTDPNISDYLVDVFENGILFSPNHKF